MKLFKWIRWLGRCIKAVWADRKNGGGRQKWRRLAREFDKQARVMGFSK